MMGVLCLLSIWKNITAMSSTPTLSLLYTGHCVLKMTKGVPENTNQYGQVIHR